MTKLRTPKISHLSKVMAITALAALIQVGASAQSSKPMSTPIHQKNGSNPTHSALAQTELPATEILDGTYSEIDGDHTIGTTTAPVTMIIYASVTCPHCAHWFKNVWPDVKKNFVDTNKLRVVFREFPTAPTNIAAIGFQIANCAPEDKYFTMIEYQMNEQENIFTSLKAGTGKETYLEIAKMAGLETEEAMNTCIQNEAGMERMNKSISLARSAKINAVPNFIINGEIFKEGSNYAPLSKHLEKMLLRGFTPMR